ncbi:hypothetical protein Tco_0911076 [Tanacetum coccineum]|uniref:Uncharacterized protein n=1 Tax=Tanacetum coccineum TaxID=301880 RepID=A0ABQ5CUR6_9ASTR
MNHLTLNPNQNHPSLSRRRNLQGFSKVLYAQVAEDNWEKHEETVASYADLNWSIEYFHATTFKTYENTNAALRNYQKIITQSRSDHVEGINKILTNLKKVQDAIKEDPALNKKVLNAAKAYTKNSSNLTELLALAEEKKETPSQPKGEQADMGIKEHTEEKVAEEEPKVTQPEPIQTILPLTQYPKTPITPEGRVIEISALVVPEVGGSSVTPRVDNGKGIAEESYPYPPKLMKASKEIRPDPDAPVLIDYKIDGKMHLFTHEEL